MRPLAAEQRQTVHLVGLSTAHEYFNSFDGLGVAGPIETLTVQTYAAYDKGSLQNGTPPNGGSDVAVPHAGTHQAE
ncbi:hypothetical protein PACILC2_43300 [Paenibacillus cisolokensis]|uniref:Uncharacterized protein n=1 Tax=Paenibacillus cisolokensis TaxID=1658519 RepID=A0ABQ4NC06_9BACL|nr:hypothetical protein PACILC2_43300 [Paenibacillus cisolokensis]